MCTVTYIPTEGKNDFIFTSNRDEAPNRQANKLVTKKIKKKKVLFPQDSGAKGTWIAISDSDQLVCILNGAFTAHKRRDDYIKSRGILALETFESASATEFLKKCNLTGIEPFTMILYDRGKLYDLKWDYNIKHIRVLDPAKKHIWASSTLYSLEWQKKRKIWFDKWRNELKKVKQKDVLDFHHNAGEGNNRYDVKMYVEGIVQTTSVTSIKHSKSEMKMRFESIINAKILKEELDLSH